MLASNYAEYPRLLKQQVRDADIILCTTPSTSPLFPADILTRPNGRLKARLIVAVGSYKPHMIELPPEILLQAVKVHGHGGHVRRRAEEGGVVLVDTVGCVRETGELTRAGLEERHVVEIGEIIMLDEKFAHEGEEEEGNGEDEAVVEDEDESVRGSLEGMDISKGGSNGGSLAQVMGEASKSRTSSRSSSFSSLSRRSSSLMHGLGHGREAKKEGDGEQMGRWLTKGNVIYKSVGVGLMDLCVGGELVRLAREKGVGTTVEDF